MKRFLLCVVFLLSCLFLYMAFPVLADAVFDDVTINPNVKKRL